uniref:Uncharacterized protein n=1 Tax=Oryza punctata TaxID=4537 RepID=A0A0E0LVZ0_ORYPU
MGGVEADCDRIRGSWSPEDDEALRRLVERHGALNWTAIRREIPGRSGKSCRLRWCNQLSPQVKRRPFTAEEDAKLQWRLRRAAARCGCRVSVAMDVAPPATSSRSRGTIASRAAASKSHRAAGQSSSRTQSFSDAQNNDEDQQEDEEDDDDEQTEDDTEVQQD